jgi:hypothetical protein
MSEAAKAAADLDDGTGAPKDGAGDGAEEDQDCVICMDNIKVGGRIPCCDHKFCYECILKVPPPPSPHPLFPCSFYPSSLTRCGVCCVFAVVEADEHLPGLQA